VPGIVDLLSQRIVGTGLDRSDGLNSSARRRPRVVATIGDMAVTDDKTPVAEQLTELGAQLAWVRDYL
jgi:hypothetical protein